MIMRRLDVVAAVTCVTIFIYGGPSAIVADELTRHGSVNLDNPKIEYRTSLTLVKRSTKDPVTMEYIDSVCGKENVIDDIKQQNVTPLSRFPWIVAILINNNNRLRFQCGGSLISTRTVLSNGLCVNDKPNELVVSMNSYNKSDWSDAFNIDVEKVIIPKDFHPDINIDSDADLAILQLKQSVTFTDSLRPICLWQGSEDVEGASGTIISWGGNKSLKPKDVPKLMNATVVSSTTCIRSNYQYSYLITNRTFCALHQDENGPCIGDTGNGLMIKKSNKWMLRGILSTTVSDSPETRCSNNYIVYTDAAKYTEWIRSNMLL